MPISRTMRRKSEKSEEKSKRSSQLGAGRGRAGAGVGAAVEHVPDLRISVYFSIAVFACRCRNLYLMTYNKGPIALREHQSHTGGTAR